MSESTMTSCPLIFQYRDLVFGRGFLANVVVRGRALAVSEVDDSVWIYGVNPGGLAESGNNPDAAHEAFRKAFALVLFDLATQASNFETFKVEVHNFVNETNRPTESDWHAAVREVRAGRLKVDGIVSQPAETPLSIEVSEIGTFTPAHNEPAALEPMLAA